MSNPTHWSRFVARAKDAAWAWGLAVAILTGAWQVAKDHPLVSSFVALPETVARIERDGTTQRTQNRSAIEQVGRRVGALEREVEDRRMEADIAEYDRTRSRVRGPCATGGWCEAEYRLRRTPIGESCGRPELVAWIGNHDGRRRRAETRFDPVRAEMEWESVTLTFRVPSGTQPGKAEFYLAVAYPDCAHAPEGAVIRERSAILPFEVVPGAP